MQSKDTSPDNSPTNPAPASSGQEEPKVVYMSRPMEPQRQQLSPEAIQKHEESKKRYPKLNISSGEYVISAVQRHPIGLVSIWLATIAVIVALIGAAVILSSLSSNGMAGTTVPIAYVLIPAILISLLALIFGFVSAWIYKNNHFYLTNESVIQHIQVSLFNKREQTISLNNIEDASYSQDGIIAHIFNYGLIRLSTQGDETTYRFAYASDPNKQIALLNNAVEDFKNVRPIE